MKRIIRFSTIVAIVIFSFSSCSLHKRVTISTHDHSYHTPYQFKDYTHTDLESNYRTAILYKSN